MRKRDPRKLLRGSRERTKSLARVRILREPESGSAPDGSVRSRQSAEITLPRVELERMWTPEYLERLARTYWAYLTRISLGLLRVLYTETAREVVFLTRPFVLLRFRAPEYETSATGGTVSWPIDRGILVAPAGRGKGFLRISVERPERLEGDQVTCTVASEVSNFYPLLAGWGWFSKIGRVVYRATQLRIHVLVTNGFLRSLAQLQLLPSVVGRLRGRGGAQQDGGGAALESASRSARR